MSRRNGDLFLHGTGRRNAACTTRVCTDRLLLNVLELGARQRDIGLLDVSVQGSKAGSTVRRSFSKLASTPAVSPGRLATSCYESRGLPWMCCSPTCMDLSQQPPLPLDRSRVATPVGDAFGEPALGRGGECLRRIFLDCHIRLAAAYASAAIRILGCRRFDLHMLIEGGSKPAQGFIQP